MKQIDLHVHSTCSDGTDSPAVLVDKAVDKGLAAFALTDMTLPWELRKLF